MLWLIIFFILFLVVVLVYVSGFGITAGAHRLWSHRSYKAKWPLRALLVFMFTIAGQVRIFSFLFVVVDFLIIVNNSWIQKKKGTCNRILCLFINH